MSTLFPLAAVEEIDIAAANELLIEWQHPLGACRRPFEQRAHQLRLNDEPIAVTVSASIVSGTCAGWPRTECVELARIARHPDQPWVLRPMLRLWREACARQSWHSWPVRAAVSYAMPGSIGNLYRFDGWRSMGRVRPSGGGGTWSSPSLIKDMADGVKTLWVWEYPT